MLVGKTTTGKLVDDKGKVLLAEGREAIDEAALDEIPRKYWGEIPVDERRGQSPRSSRELEEHRPRPRRALPRQDRAPLARATSFRRASSRW